MPAHNNLDYLRNVLALDPAIDAMRIVSLRTAFQGTGGDAAPLSDADALIVYRRSNAKRLESLRSTIWDLDVVDLTRGLHEIDVRTCPELSPDVARLLRVAAQRPAIERLARRTGAEADFLDSFRRIVAASPSDAGRLRNASLAALRDAPRGRRDPAVKAAVAVARRIATDHPAILAIEDEWLAAVLHIGSRPARWRSEAPWLLAALSVPIAVYLLIMLLAFRVLR